MSNYVFKIFYGEKDKKGEEYSAKDEDLVSEPLKNFVRTKEKTLEDFAFYYKGRPVKYENLLHIKDSIFSQNEGRKPNIIAININKKPVTLKKEIKKEEISQNKEIKEKEENQNEININNIAEPEKNNDIKEKNFVRRKRINKEYYNDIICPKCKTSAIIENGENFKLNILNCGNFHYLKDIKYNAFDDYVFDLDDESPENLEKLLSNKDLLQCDLCSNNIKNITPPKDFLYICSCGANVCPECITNHNKENHFKIKLNDKDYYCLIHGEKFDSYCIDCNANFCDKCKKNHDGHDIELFSKIRPKREYVKKLAEEADKQKEILLDFVEDIRYSFDKIIDSIESYLNSYIMIEKTLIRRFNLGLCNYQLIRNLKNKKLFHNKVFETLDELNKNNDLNKKFNSLLNDIYNKINKIKKKSSKRNDLLIDTKNEMIIDYEIRDKTLDRRIKLFDPVFVENNKNKLSLYLVDDEEKPKELELSVYYNNINDKQKIKVIIKENQNQYVTDMSYMFNNCKYLKSVNFKNWKTDNIVSMEAMFQSCDISLNDIKIENDSKLNITNLENIRAMFCKCTKINNIFDINKWFTFKESKIKDMSMLFNGCKNLKIISFTSEWNLFTTNVENMSYMFNNCKNLREINKLKYLQTKSVKKMVGMFNNCQRLGSISLSFDCPKLEDMSIMFQGCKALTKLDNNKYNNTKNLKDISGMFSNCVNLDSTKNFYINNTENLVNLVGLFNNCIALKTFPDLSKWSLNKVENAKGLFHNSKLSEAPKWLYAWRFKEGIKFEEILEKCNFKEKDALINNWKNNEIKPSKIEII